MQILLISCQTGFNYVREIRGSRKQTAIFTIDLFCRGSLTFFAGENRPFNPKKRKESTLPLVGLSVSIQLWKRGIYGLLAKENSREGKKFTSKLCPDAEMKAHEPITHGKSETLVLFCFQMVNFIFKKGAKLL